MTTPPNKSPANRKSAPVTSWSRPRTRPRRSRRTRQGRRFRRTRQEEIQGSRRLRRRRSRLLHQGSDGAGIIGRRIRAGAGQDLRSREIAVRLAHHQGRGKAQPQAAGIRPGQEPRSRPVWLRKAQADYVGEAARRRQDRTHGPGRQYPGPLPGAAKPAAQETEGPTPQRFQDGAGEEVKIRSHFFEANCRLPSSWPGLRPGASTSWASVGVQRAWLAASIEP